MTALERYLELKKQESSVVKELELLKKEIRELYSLGDTEVGDIKVSRSMRTRIDIDKEKVLIRLGVEAFQECEKISEYEVLVVKRF